MNDQVCFLIESLQLRPHPEGGFFSETFRSNIVLQGLAHGGPRAASTAIYFLLPAGDFSAFHRVKSDEVWHHYDGDPVELHTITEQGEYLVQMLGAAISEGQRPQLVVSAGTWQAARATGDRYSLCGCTVAPGFEYEDFEMPSCDELSRLFPQHAVHIRALCRRVA